MTQEIKLPEPDRIADFGKPYYGADTVRKLLAERDAEIGQYPEIQAMLMSENKTLRAEVERLKAALHQKRFGGTEELVVRLRNTPNWSREDFTDWKTGTSKYDRAPFEAADRIEELQARLGNGDQYGNSVGNEIARAALGEVK